MGDVKLHHVHATPQSTRLEFDDLDRMTWRAEGRHSMSLKSEVAIRAATCWNVLEGFPTDALADGVIRDIFIAIRSGDLALAHALVAKFDAQIELTADGDAHACAACLKDGD
jgi:hypothetical protein